MMTVRLPEDLEERLAALAKETHRSKSYYIKEALREYLEDREDYLLALSALERYEAGEEKTVPFDDILKKYGPSDEVH